MRVFLIGRTTLAPGVNDFLRYVRGEDAIDLINHQADTVAEIAGRLCYKSWAPYDGTDKTNANVTRIREGNAEYMANLINSGHGSVLEHVNFTFALMGVSRILTHELVRHRAGMAYSQESLRYVRLQDLELVMPTKDQLASLPQGIIGATVADIRESITALNKILIEDDPDTSFKHKKTMTSLIRRIAPLGISTNIIFTANARALRHVIVQRTSPHAEVEIQGVFRAIADMVKEQAPAIFADVIQKADGSYTSEFTHWVCENCDHRKIRDIIPGPCKKCGANDWRGYTKERGKV